MNKNLGARHAIMQLCLCIFCITLPLNLIYEYWITQDISSQFLIIFIYGVAGISIYIILGSIFKKYYSKLNEQQDEERDAEE